MGKRYYCDYCDRSFIDDIQARKKHLNGTCHLRNRKLHYMQYRDLKTIINEESAKEECYKFKKYGECSFGENCFRSHFTKQQLQIFRNQLAEEENSKIYRYMEELGTVDSWLQKRNSIIPYQIPENIKNVQSLSHLPKEINYSNALPPSLCPLHFTNLTDAEVSEWG